AHYPPLALRGELLGACLQPLAHLAPVVDGVVVEHVARPEDEILVVRERHVGVLGLAFSRRERSAPAVFAARDSVTAADGELPLRGQLVLPAFGVQAGE